MRAQVESGLELIFLNQIPRFRIGTCLGGGCSYRVKYFFSATKQPE